MDLKCLLLKKIHGRISIQFHTGALTAFLHRP
jgi:hypothetical protein